MSISDFITRQIPARLKLLAEIHEIIIQEDKSVKAAIEPMMGKEMIVYKAPGIFKYGLSSMKNYMSLHVMPIYGSPTLHSKYQQLLKNASFQKGCINFKTAEEMPLKIVRELIIDCSKIDLRAIKEEYTKSRSRKA
jgi:hypothetical protein